MTAPLLPNAGAPVTTLHIPGLITAAGVTPNADPNAPVPAAQPGAVVPQPTYAPPVSAAPPATGAPVAVSAAVQPLTAQEPAAPAVLAAAVPASPAPVLPTAVPGMVPPVVPGLNPQVAPAAAPAAAPADRGYPEGTPLEQMSAEQREAYWKYHARHWESRSKARDDYDALKAKAEQYDQQVAANATEQEKAVAAAYQRGTQEATARAAVVLVDAHVRAGLQSRLNPDQVEALAGKLHHSHFLAADGLTVDAAKVSEFVNTVAPAPAAPAVTAPAVPAAPGALPTGLQAAVPGQPGMPATGMPRALPDLGQGTQTSAPLDKLEAGRQQARAFLAGNR